MAGVVANGASGCAGLKARFVESRLASSHWLVPVRAAHFAEQRRGAFNMRLTRQNGGAQRRRQQGAVVKAFLPADPWAPGVDSQSIASSLFAASLFPYLGFLYHLTKSKTAPPLTLFGFYFLLVFVGATIPAGIYAKVHYGTSLSNVDWLHGGAESLLTLTNLFIVFGLRGALRTPTEEKSTVEVEQDEKLPLSK